jgi:peptidoglycan/xylan/chitin deacetylase (PgdA/CDA1 family)
VAARELIPASPSSVRLAGTPVFMYHALAPDGSPSGESPYCLGADVFVEHLGALRATGRRVIDLATFWRGDAAGPAAVLTFDDGLLSDYTLALPRLLDAGAPATFFLNTSTIEGRGYLSWSQIQQMQRMGMSFQSHAHDHVYLSRLSAVQVARQLEYSKSLIEDRLGAPVEFLAAPFGDWSQRVVDMALAVGYHAVCTSLTWLARPRRVTVSRIAITVGTTPRELMAFAVGVPGPFVRRAVRSALVYLPKRVRVAVRARRGTIPVVTVEA